MKKTTTFFLCVLLFAALLGLTVSPAVGQSQPQLQLSLTKVVGYRSGFWSSKIEAQGTLLLTAKGPDNLTRVAYFIDGTQMGEVTQAPFSLQFYSGSYALGTHTFTATGYTRDGSRLESNQLVADLVTAGRGIQAGLTIAIPILLIALIAMLLPVISGFLTRGKLAHLPAGTRREYGAAGGTICARCGRPFALHAFSPHLLTFKLERCPFCGRIALVRRKPVEQLRAAELAELSSAGSVAPSVAASEEEKLRKEMDDSRFREL